MLAVIGGLVILSIMALFVIGFSAFSDVRELVAEAESYVEETVSAYSKTWDPIVLMERAGPALSKSLLENPDALPAMSALLTKNAGSLVSVEPPVCDNINWEKSLGEELIFTVGCEIAAVSEGGALLFTVNAEKRGDKWFLLGFFATGEALLEPLSSAVLVSQPMMNHQAGVPSFAVKAGAVSSRPFLFSLHKDRQSIALGTLTREDMKPGIGVQN